MTVYQNFFAERIGGQQFGLESKAYKFAKIKAAKEAALLENPEVELLDFGVGEPDQSAPTEVIAALAEESSKWENRVYADNGCVEYKVAVAEFMEKVYSVTLDPSSEVLHSMGSKSALALLPSCFVDPGDVVLTTTPGYSVFATNASYLGAEIYEMPITQETAFLPDLSKIPSEVIHKAKVLVINYPNNPTGACATKAFFEEVVSWAKEHEVLVVQDAAYSALTFGDKQPLSILQIPGAKDVCLELHSLSKSYSMTGWRIGWVCGAKPLIDAYAHVKDNTDSGQFLAIQKAAITALRNLQFIKENSQRYSRRLSKLAGVLKKHGFSVIVPDAGFFLYVPVPKTMNDEFIESAEHFSDKLIREMLISTVPWDESGRYIRFSATYLARDESEEDRAMCELDRRLSPYKFSY